MMDIMTLQEKQRQEAEDLRIQHEKEMKVQRDREAAQKRLQLKIEAAEREAQREADEDIRQIKEKIDLPGTTPSGVICPTCKPFSVVKKIDAHEENGGDYSGIRTFGTYAIFLRNTRDGHLVCGRCGFKAKAL